MKNIFGFNMSEIKWQTGQWWQVFGKWQAATLYTGGVSFLLIKTFFLNGYTQLSFLIFCLNILLGIFVSFYNRATFTGIMGFNIILNSVLVTFIVGVNPELNNIFLATLVTITFLFIQTSGILISINHSRYRINKNIFWLSYDNLQFYTVYTPVVVTSYICEAIIIFFSFFLFL